jgi:3-polyprenyl-4-hydroxybenzoate decarboxylase
MGKAIFFHEVTGSARPVLSNIYGSRERLAEILGIGPMDFCGLWNNLAHLTSTRDFRSSRIDGPKSDAVSPSLSVRYRVRGCPTAARN